MKGGSGARWAMAGRDKEDLRLCGPRGGGKYMQNSVDSPLMVSKKVIVSGF